MNDIQNFFVILWAFYSLTAAVLGYRQTKVKNNPYGLCMRFNPLGAFVWADAVIFGSFYFLVSLFVLFTQDFVLFLLIISLFWATRSIGEQIYWFLEQFATNHRNPEHTLWFSKYFKRNSSWIVMQIFWQCLCVVSIVSSVYLFKIWLF